MELGVGSVLGVGSEFGEEGEGWGLGGGARVTALRAAIRVTMTTMPMMTWMMPARTRSTPACDVWWVEFGRGGWAFVVGGMRVGRGAKRVGLGVGVGLKLRGGGL